MKTLGGAKNERPSHIIHQVESHLRVFNSLFLSRGESPVLPEGIDMSELILFLWSNQYLTLLLLIETLGPTPAFFTNMIVAKHSTNVLNLIVSTLRVDFSQIADICKHKV